MSQMAHFLKIPILSLHNPMCPLNSISDDMPPQLNKDTQKIYPSKITIHIFKSQRNFCAISEKSLEILNLIYFAIKWLLMLK